MRPQYDTIGGHYANWKQTPIPVYLEVPTVRRLLDGLVDQRDTARYGFAIRTVASDEDWFLVHADIHTTPPSSLEYRHWARHMYWEALEAAGFHDLQWHVFEISPEGLARYGQEYWRPFLENPPSAALTARLSEAGGS